ncbi:MAG: L,D-transpeptidase family protein [Helicobacter trogontum]|uniref:L,D-TPase catalytic domain-containing protein n=1 Tax=Helicobacter trogontum TaxID=50960 RepID=A0A4U8T5R4_9HELI|nr:L,D-transpeptidase family protein [Helicobacter trogontum]MCI5786161.1 L,D-transpeptidase family protein [Helicobacter trogontum]TLD94890.1 hypothetical protein LS80_009735 [Helicobacter trogontum]
MARSFATTAIILCCFIIAITALYQISIAVERNQEYPIDWSLKDNVAKIVVHKHKRVLELYDDKGQLLKSYPHIALGKNPYEHKMFEGDGKTPEGLYYIDSKNPNSRYFLNLGISYPNQTDIANAKRHNKSAGGDIKIHGLPNGMNVIKELFLQYGDWTDGCIALDNASMKELYEIISIKTPIYILP